MDIIILVATCVINFALGAIILMQDPRNNYLRAFALISGLTCFWSISNYVTELSLADIAVNGIANNLAFITGYCVMLAAVLFTYLFPVQRRVKTYEVFIISIVSLIVIAMSSTPLIAGTVTENTDGILQFSNGPWLWLYIVSFISLLAIIARNSLFSVGHLQKSQKTQAWLVFMAFFTGGMIGLLFNIILPIFMESWHTTRYGPPIGSLALVGIIVYAISKHRLFDIRLVVVRSATYVLTIGTLAALYFLIAYSVSSLLFSPDTPLVSQSPVSIGLALVLALLFQPIKRFFDKLTNKVFYRDNYSTDEFFARLNRKLSSTTDLRGLLKTVSAEISTTLKASQGYFFIYTAHGHYVSVGTVDHTHLPKLDAIELDKYVSKTQATIITLDAPATPQLVHRIMISHKAELILPLVMDKGILGYLLLGEHRVSKFVQRDIKVLETIADELVIAIQNALSVEQIKDINAHLQQRIDHATKDLRSSNAQLRRLDEAKDEFISMASHQLRTPLTGVKGYISMVMDGDAGEVTDSQKHLLNEAFISSERMVRLINDFLNVSRLQTGKFTLDTKPTDLSKVVTEELNSLQPNASPRGLSFNFTQPTTFPTLNFDEAKIRQVIMNFADNALYYSREDTIIDVSLAIENDEVIFKVKDKGIGVPKSEQARLFNKFFRATNARRQRPDGTGVGLFLAKKVVTAHHGDVIFESEEGKGSTFGFRIPVHEVQLAGESE